MKWLWVSIALALAACGFGDNSNRQGGGTDANGPGEDAKLVDAAVVGEDAHVEEESCKLLPQSGCATPTPACDLAAADDGTLACRAVSANGSTDSRCSSATACLAGYTCLGDLGVDSACYRFCGSDADCFGPGGRCVFTLTDGSGAAIDAKVCSNSCTLITQTGCPTGLGCVGFNATTGADYTDCQLMGTKPDGAICSATQECRNGSVCVQFGGTATCASYCRDQLDCFTTQQCRAFASPLIIGATTYGFCE